MTEVQVIYTDEESAEDGEVIPYPAAPAPQRELVVTDRMRQHAAELMEQHRDWLASL